MANMRIRFRGEEFEIELYEDKAPKACAALRRAGKVTSMIVYAKICDHEITWPMPYLVDELENPVWEEELGSVIYYPQSQSICIFYGPTPAVAWCNQIGKVAPEDIDRLASVADDVWAHEGQLIETEADPMEGMAHPCDSDILLAPTGNKAVDAFVERSGDAYDAVWNAPSPDIRRMLHKNIGIGKNLSTSVFAFGDTSAIEGDAWTWYRRGKGRKGDLGTLTSLAAERLTGAAKSFRDCYDFQDTANLLEEAADALGAVNTHAELASVAFALERYLVLIHYWVDAAIPFAELCPAHAEMIRARLSIPDWQVGVTVTPD